MSYEHGYKTKGTWCIERGKHSNLEIHMVSFLILWKNCNSSQQEMKIFTSLLPIWKNNTDLSYAATDKKIVVLCPFETIQQWSFKSSCSANEREIITVEIYRSWS